jgi:hypothetical protein
MSVGRPFHRNSSCASTIRSGEIAASALTSATTSSDRLTRRHDQISLSGAPAQHLGWGHCRMEG